MQASATVRNPQATMIICALLLGATALAQEPLPDRPELVLATGDGDRIVSVAFSPDGALVATGSYAGTLVVRDVQTGQVLGRLKLGWRGYGVCFTPDGGRVVTPMASEVAQWDVRTLKRTDRCVHLEVTGLPDPFCVRISADGTRLLVGMGFPYGPPPDADLAEALAVRLFDLTTGATLAVMRGHTNSVWAVAFADDGRTIVSAGDDGTVRRWDAATGEEQSRMSWGQPRAWRGIACPPPMALSSDGALLAVGLAHYPEESVPAVEAVSIWDTVAGTEIRRLTFEDQGDWADTDSVCFSPDDTVVAGSSLDYTVRLWDVEGKRRWGDFWAPLSCLAISADGQRLAAGTWAERYVAADELYLFDASRTHCVMASPVRTQPASALSYSPDGRRLAAVSEGVGNILVIWDTETGSPLVDSDWIGSRAVSFSPDGRRVLLSSAGCRGMHAAALVLDSANGERLGKFGLRTARSTISGEFSPDGRTVASCFSDGTLVLWDPETGAELHRWAGHFSAAAPLSFSPDGKLLAASGAGAQVLVYDITALELVAAVDGHPQPPTALAFSHSGRLLASGSYPDTVRITDTTTWQSMEVSGLTGCLHYPEQLVWTEDDRELICVGTGGWLRCFDPETGEMIWAREGASESRSGRVVLSPDRRRIATTGGDGIGIWDADSGRLLARLIMTVSSSNSFLQGHLITTPEGYYTGTVDAARLVTWRVGDQVYPAEAYREVFERPDLVARSLRGEPLTGLRGLSDEDVPPGVQILSPRPLERVSPGEVPVSLVTYGYREVRSIEIYANGRRVSSEIERGILIAARGIIMAARDLPRQYRVTRSFSGVVPLPPGEEQVTLRFVAVDEADLRSQPAEVTVIQSGATPIPGALHVLAVGLSRYRERGLRLGAAAADAQALAEALAAQAGPERLYERVVSTVLTDADATAPAIRRALEGVVREAEPGDSVLLFLSGHGLRDDHFQYYFATHETDLDDLAGTALGWTQFQDMVRRLRARQVLVLLDTCHAGAALGEYLLTTQALGEALADRAGVMVLASSSAAERSYESPEWGHGAFTLALLEALAGACGPRLTPGVLEDFVGARVAELTSGRQHPYVPIRTQFPAGTPLLLAPER